MIAEGSSTRLAYKFYSDATIVPNVDPDVATSPGASDGKIIRRVSASINLAASATKSNEILPSKQIRSYRQTSRSVAGSISGELSPGNWFPFIEAALRSATRSAETEGFSVIAPATGQVKRKLAVEVYREDLDKARLYTELRVSGFKITTPTEGISTIEVDVTGRSRKTFSGANAPYFVNPTDANSLDVMTSLGGSVTLGGVQIGLVTAFDMTVASSVDAPKVLGSKMPADVLLGTLNVNGNISFLADSVDAATTAFEAESEVALVVTLTNQADGGDFITFELPRVKLGAANEAISGEGSQVIACTWQALEAASGDILSTIKVTDSSITA